ncbi:hypothetical protein AGMMS50276_27280 [Synergistales bacterium]|nr:hypothetical protein AGMMS50276_27280 [Synergistales bacterium]
MKEKTALDKAVERLSRNLMNFDNANELHENYFSAVKKNFDDNTVLIIDDSDVTKPCGKKLEGLCKVRDGSTNEIRDGYWVTGVSALTAGRKQPIPVYSRVYSTVEKGYLSNNDETLKSLKFLSSNFPETNIRAFDRGYDAGYKIDESIEVLEVIEVSKRLYGLSKFTFYAMADGLAEIFGKLYTGISSFYERPPRSN